MADRSQYPSEQADKYLLRLPDGMREQISEAAKANKRSMNAEIIARLDASFAVADVSKDEIWDRRISELDQKLAQQKADIDELMRIRRSGEL